MNKIVYYVATSIDGYISRNDGDISGFVGEGNGVEKYLNDLSQFETVIMGKSTYEFGYDYGLIPGQPAYPHMEHFIFSKSLKFKEQHPKVHVIDEYDISKIEAIRDQSNTDIYLCGGGIFAGWLLEHKLIDVLKVKYNPLIIGSGVPIFANSNTQYRLRLEDTQTYDNGLLINTYQLIYNS